MLEIAKSLRLSQLNITALRVNINRAPDDCRDKEPWNTYEAVIKHLETGGIVEVRLPDNESDNPLFYNAIHVDRQVVPAFLDVVMGKNRFVQFMKDLNFDEVDQSTSLNDYCRGRIKLEVRLPSDP